MGLAWQGEAHTVRWPSCFGRCLIMWRIAPKADGLVHAIAAALTRALGCARTGATCALMAPSRCADHHHGMMACVHGCTRLQCNSRE